jgi:glyoxalase superfamily protein
MPVRYQVTFDASDPHALAAFWAEATGYVVEEYSEFIRGLLDAGVAGPDDVEEADGRLRWRDAASIRDPDAPVDERGVGKGARMYFQRVPEPKAAKNRVHLDLNVGKDKIEAEAERLSELGGRILYRGEQGGSRWVTMADPDGNEFCLQ